MSHSYYDHPWLGSGRYHPEQATGREMLDGYYRYVDYMVRHFGNRVAYYEIFNEWKLIGVGIKKYCEILNKSIEVIRNADPNARISVGGVGTGASSTRSCACSGAEPCRASRMARSNYTAPGGRFSFRTPKKAITGRFCRWSR